MWKFISFVFETFIIGYAFWIAFWKPEVTMKDLAFLISMTLITVLTCENKLSRIEKKLGK